MSTQAVETPKALTKDDYSSGQEVRWCPGCGDYAVLAAVQRLLPSLSIPPEKLVFVSGIGCSSRFPYYMNTYGFHTIHGRAPAIATGVRIANPDLSVWVVTGDGDALSIGGNHIIHLLRRNVDVNVLLFNNRIYGLTKGQYSPTSEVGKVTKSSPLGSVDTPLQPLCLALGSQATFLARSIDVEAQHLSEVLKRANEHRGTSFVEIYQNCNIFNDGAWQSLSDRSQKVETQLLLEHNKPMLFGKDKSKGLVIDQGVASIVELEGRSPESLGIAVHDESNLWQASVLVRLSFPEFPVPLGVLYRKERAVFEQALLQQQASRASSDHEVDATLRALYRSGDTWEVEG